MYPTENKLATVSLDSDSIIEYIKEQIKAHPQRAKSFSAVILFKITHNGKVVKNWTLDLPAANLYQGEPTNNKKPDTVITISDENFVNVMKVQLNPQQGLMEGKIEMTGNGTWMHKVWVLFRTTAASKL